MNGNIMAAIAMTPVASYAIAVRDGVSFWDAFTWTAMFLIAILVIGIISFRR